MREPQRRAIGLCVSQLALAVSLLAAGQSQPKFSYLEENIVKRMAIDGPDL